MTVSTSIRETVLSFLLFIFQGTLSQPNLSLTPPVKRFPVLMSQVGRFNSLRSNFIVYVSKQRRRLMPYGMVLSVDFNRIYRCGFLRFYE